MAVNDPFKAVARFCRKDPPGPRKGGLAFSTPSPTSPRQFFHPDRAIQGRWVTSQTREANLVPRNDSSRRRVRRKPTRIPKKGGMGVRPRTGGLDLDYIRKELSPDGKR